MDISIDLDINAVTIGFQMGATILLLIVVWFFFTKPMKKFLAERQAHLDDVFVNAEKVTDEAKALKDEATNELKKIQEEAGQMMQEANTKAQIKYDNILASAKTDAESELKKARLKIEKEREDMLYDAKKEITRTTSEVASKLVKKEMDASKHDDLFDDFVQLIGGGSHD